MAHSVSTLTSGYQRLTLTTSHRPQVINLQERFE